MSPVADYRKKPVVIEAVQFDGTEASVTEICDWATGIHDADVSGQLGGDVHVVVHTLEGDMRADPGDWIIRGVKGEFYPCKPDIFEATYEPAEEASMRPDVVAVYRDSAGEWRWRRLAPNGETVADSAEGYRTRWGARRAAKRVNPGLELEVSA